MKPKEHPDHGGLVSLRLLIALAIGLGAPFLLMGATGPAWWYNGSLTTTGAPLITGTASDFSAANQGQAKNIAVTAVNELNTDLAQFGGAGDTLNQLAIALTATSAQTSDFSALTIGQLKFLAQPFYDRLISLSCTVPPIVSGTYPWAVSQSPKNDFAICNIGQLKELFSFDVTASSAGTGIPDWWVEKYFPGASLSGTGALNPNAYVAWSGSQVTYLTAYQNGWNPLDFYNGQTPTLTIVSGAGQTGSPGGFVPAPLVVSITDTNGIPISSAPVTFAAVPGGGFLQGSSTSGSSSTLTVLADGNGQAQAFFQLPNTLSSTSTVTAAAGSGSPAATGTFSEFADDGTGSYPSPFAPSNIIGTMNPDGSETITWQNNDSSSPIYVYELSGTTWSVSATLLAGTTTYTVPASLVGLMQIGNNYSLSESNTPAGPNGYPSIPSGTPTYAVIDLDQGGGKFTPSLINAKGTILGTSSSPAIWQSGSITSVPLEYVSGLNDSDTVSGCTAGDDGLFGQTVPQVWSATSGSSTLCNPDCLDFDAIDPSTGLPMAGPWSLALTSDFKRVLIALVSSYWTSYMSQAWVT